MFLSRSPNLLLGNNSIYMVYHSYIVENFACIIISTVYNSTKLWQIWQFMTDLPKFYLPTVLILAILLCKAVNPPIFCPPKCCNNLPTFSTIKIFYRQSFVLHNILVYKLLQRSNSLYTSLLCFHDGYGC